MKEKNVTLWLIVLLVLVNLPSVYNYGLSLWGRHLEASGNYEKAMEWFQKGNDDLAKINQAHLYYKQKLYQKALSLYDQISQNSHEKHLVFSSLSNAGNAHYFIGKSEQNPKSKKIEREKSIHSYQEALKISNDKQVLENLQKVQKELQELEKQLQETQTPPPAPQNPAQDTENASSQNSSSGSSNQTPSSGSGSQTSQNSSSGSTNQEPTSGSGSQTPQNSSSGSTNQTPSSGSGGIGSQNSHTNQEASPLTPEQLKALNDYQRELLESQKSNQDGFNKIYQEPTGNEGFPFFPNPLFNDYFRNQNASEKDW